jgi:hypothetical protein
MLCRTGRRGSGAASSQSRSSSRSRSRRSCPRQPRARPRRWRCPRRGGYRDRSPACCCQWATRSNCRYPGRGRPGREGADWDHVPQPGAEAGRAEAARGPGGARGGEQPPQRGRAHVPHELVDLGRHEQFATEILMRCARLRSGEAPPKLREEMVPKRGLEPRHPCGH